MTVTYTLFPIYIICFHLNFYLSCTIFFHLSSCLFISLFRLLIHFVWLSLCLYIFFHNHRLVHLLLCLFNYMFVYIFYVHLLLSLFISLSVYPLSFCMFTLLFISLLSAMGVIDMRQILLTNIQSGRFHLNRIFACNRPFTIFHFQCGRELSIWFYKQLLRGGGQEVSVLTLYSNDPSSNPAEAYSVFCEICVWKEQK